MKKLLVASALLASFITACLIASAAQPPEGKGPPGGRKGQQGDAKDKAGPRRFELGRVLPPPMREELKLSEDQIKQLDALEKEVKDKLMKILTEEQKKRLSEIGQRSPRGGPDDKGGRPPGDNARPRSKGDKKGPPNDDRPNRGEKKGPPPEPNSDDTVSGIQWFGTLERGLQEAHRTGRPILFLAAAPHCGGISGIW